MLENLTIIRCTDQVASNNQMLAATLMLHNVSLQEQIAANPMINSKESPLQSLGISTILIPRAGTLEFCMFATTDTNIGEQNFVILATDWKELPVALDALPVPLYIVDPNKLWGSHMRGEELDQENVYYLCTPGRTSLLQRVYWEFGNLGIPQITGRKSIVLYEYERNSITYDRSVQGYLHELLPRPSWIEVPESHLDLEAPIVLPDLG